MAIHPTADYSPGNAEFQEVAARFIVLGAFTFAGELKMLSAFPDETQATAFARDQVRKYGVKEVYVVPVTLALRVKV
jgi:hypothetical protein